MTAQAPKKEKKFFSSQISTGVVEGEQGTSFHIEVLNGIRYKTWFGGIGTGLDYYYFRSIPVYLSGIKYLSKRNHSFFIQGDAGMNFAWVEDRMNVWNEVSHEYKPGMYWNGMLGFATGLDRKNSFSFAEELVGSPAAIEFSSFFFSTLKLEKCWESMKVFRDRSMQEQDHF